MLSRTFLSALLLLRVAGGANAGAAKSSVGEQLNGDQRVLLQDDEYSPPVYGSPPPPSYYLLQSVNLHKVLRKEEKKYSYKFDKTSCPANLSWVDEGAVAAPRTQGDCGVAWAFATVGAVEAAYYLSTHKQVSLSNLQLMECDPGNPVSCEGGDVEVALMGLTGSRMGLTEAKYYRGYDNLKCALNWTDKEEVAAMVHIEGYQVVPADEDALKTAVCQQPVIVYMQATDNFAHYEGGIFDDPTCNTDWKTSREDLNHAVLVVGYGATAKGEDYFLIKNSWKGAALSIGSWGEGGFMKIKAGVNMCGIVSGPGYFPQLKAFKEVDLSGFNPYYKDVYTVQPGDTAFSVAKKFDLTFSQWLPHFNPDLEDAASKNSGVMLMAPGDEITVPSMHYMAISDGDCIRKVSAAGQLFPLSGNCEEAGWADGEKVEALFNRPHGIAMDKDGVVYVADTENHCIRKVQLDGSVTTVAGYCGFPGAYDGQGEYAEFNQPRGIAVDDDGFLFVADSGNNCIRKISPTGQTIAFAGSCGAPRGRKDGNGPQAEFDGPSDVAIDRDGNVFVADTNNNCIRRIRSYGKVEYLAGWCGQATTTKGTADGVRKDARFNKPTGLTIDKSGVLYVADSENNCIRQVSGGGNVKTIAGECGDDTMGTLDGQGSRAAFHHPTTVTVDLLGNVLVMDTNNHCIREIDQYHRVTTVSGVCGSNGEVPENQRMQDPWGMAIYVAPLRPPPPPAPPPPPPPPPSPNPPPPPPSGCPPDFPFRCMSNWNQAICFKKPEFAGQTGKACGGPFFSWCGLSSADIPEALLALIGTQGTLCTFPKDWDHSNVQLPGGGR